MNILQLSEISILRPYKVFYLECVASDIKFSMTSFLSQNAVLLQDYQTFSHLILLWQEAVGTEEITLENGQLAIYDLAINAFGVAADQEFTTIKINEAQVCSQAIGKSQEIAKRLKFIDILVLALAGDMTSNNVLVVLMMIPTVLLSCFQGNCL